MIALLIPLASLGIFSPVPASASVSLAVADTVEIHEWTVPWEATRPRDPIVDPDGRVWFVGQRGNYLAALDPASGKFERVELPPGALPHNVIVGPTSALYAGNGDGHIAASIAPR